MSPWQTQSVGFSAGGAAASTAWTVSKIVSLRPEVLLELDVCPDVVHADGAEDDLGVRF